MFANEIKTSSHVICSGSVWRIFRFSKGERHKQIHEIESFLKTAYLMKENLQKASNDAIKHLKNIFPWRI